MSKFRSKPLNRRNILFKVIVQNIIFVGIIFALYFLIIEMIFSVIIDSQPKLMDRPPAHEPKIIQSPTLFADYLEGVSGDAPALLYEGRVIKTLCLAAIYQSPERKDLKYSAYIQERINYEMGDAFMIFFGEKNKYIGAIEAGDRQVNPEPLTWGQCVDLGRQ
ncbi:hypothetical protein [Elstera sp.]|jgi:hypothetical protein|uniref:hypothetical protein n=1 Tax=Elstera sp. TaxID=1916664 RepID=UPI0037BFCB8D